MNDIVESKQKASVRSVAPIVKAKFLVADQTRLMIRPALEMATTGNVTRGILSYTKNSEHDYEVALHWVNTIPDTETLYHACEVFEIAITRPASPPEITVAIAWLIDSYPNRGVAIGSGYSEMVEMLLGNFEDRLSIESIAAGMFALVRECRFVPAPSEILEAALLARRRFEGALHRARHLIEMRRSAEDVISLHEHEIALRS